MFNIISDSQINLTFVILNPALTTKEQINLQTIYVRFMVNRCDLTINDINFTTNHRESSTTFIWIKAVYEQFKSITLSSMNIAIGGNLLDSLDPLSLYLSNLNIDYYKNKKMLFIHSTQLCKCKSNKWDIDCKYICFQFNNKSKITNRFIFVCFN